MWLCDCFLPCKFLATISTLILQVFILMVKQKCAELGLEFNINSVISDFELNIMKSIDDMLENVDILGCFFHLKKIFKTKVDKKGMKNRYEEDYNFRNFVNECSAVAHLPEDVLETAVDYIEKKYNFEDEKADKFKNYFIKYIQDYCINGCYPPRTWNCWSRSEDLTNNNQEGYNSKTNKSLDQNHPSPGLQLCNVVSQIREAHDLLTRTIVGIPKPRNEQKFFKLSKRRLRLKKNFVLDKSSGTLKTDLNNFLSAMGHNMTKSVVAENVQTKTSRRKDKNQTKENEDESFNTSMWHTEKETSIFEEMQQTEQPYAQRQVGVTARVQKAMVEIPNWSGKICPSYGKKFNKLSKPLECKGCDSFTHNKFPCLSAGTMGTDYECKVCKPATNKKPVHNQHAHEEYQRDQGFFKCKLCPYENKSKYNIK